MTKVKRLGVLLVAAFAFAAWVAPTAFGDAGGGPGSNSGCPDISHRPRPTKGVGTSRLEPRAFV